MANKVFEMMYQGLNIMDEMATVEFAVDEANTSVHIYDAHQVVMPMYSGKIGQYVLSDDFYKMAQVLFAKKIMPSTIDFTQWLHAIHWYFYMPVQKIIYFYQATEAQAINKAELYEKYVNYVTNM